MEKMDIQKAQSLLREEGIDAWMIYDFRGSNSIAWKIAGLTTDTHCTRRWALVIPAHGLPMKIVPKLEAHSLAHLDYVSLDYDSRDTWQSSIVIALAGCKRVAMEYSPMNNLPVHSKVDAGTVENLRMLGYEIVSSENVAQHFNAVWTEEQLAENANTAKTVRRIMMNAFKFVESSLQTTSEVSEFAVQQFIMTEFEREYLTTDHAPIVAIAPNASMPHYAPSAMQSSMITRGVVLLIDMWAKPAHGRGTYADITWMGFTGAHPPDSAIEKLDTIIAGRDAALNLVKSRFSEGEQICGWEVDAICRKVIADRGYGGDFIHRTGHNITEETHGPGANMDDFETHDTRRIIPMTSFSIEPGIYLKNEIGLRTEIDVVINKNGDVLVPSEPMQDRFITMNL